MPASISYTVKLFAAVALTCAAGGILAGEVTASTLAHFKKMDADGNGKLDAKEHAKGARAMFIAMDPDGSDTVTAEEMDEVKRARSDSAAPAELTSAEKIAVIDADGDGSLSLAEHEDGARSMFVKMDTNTDGFIHGRGIAGRARYAVDAQVVAPFRVGWRDPPLGAVAGASLQGQDRSSSPTAYPGEGRPG